MKHKHYGSLDLSVFKYICVCIISFIAKASTILYRCPRLPSNSIIVVPVVNTLGDSTHIFHQSQLIAELESRECHVILTPTAPASDVAMALFDEKYVHFYSEPLYLMARFLIPKAFRRSSIDHLILYHLRRRLCAAGDAFYSAHGLGVDDIFGATLKEHQLNLSNKHLELFLKRTPQSFVELVKYSRLLNLSAFAPGVGSGTPNPAFLHKQLGITSPYVCMHIKEKIGNQNFPQPREISNRETYKALINLIVSRGYTVVEIGAAHPSRTFGNIAGYVNYANSEFQSIANDIELIRGCDFYVGQNSGPYSIALMFRKPLLMLNFIGLPINTVKTPFSLYLIKKIIDKNKGRLMSVDEYMDSECFYYNDLVYFSLVERRYAPQDNTEMEIVSAGEEFLERLSLYRERGDDSLLNSDQQEDYLRKINLSHLCLYESRALLAKVNFIG